MVFKPSWYIHGRSSTSLADANKQGQHSLALCQKPSCYHWNHLYCARDISLQPLSPFFIWSTLNFYYLFLAEIIAHDDQQFVFQTSLFGNDSNATFKLTKMPFIFRQETSSTYLNCSYDVLTSQYSSRVHY